MHVLLHHDDGSIALDTTIDFPSGSNAVTVSLTVKLLDDAPASGEQMHLTLDYLNAAGAVVFEGGPILITAAPAPADGTLNPPVQVPISYIGPGSNAASVAIAPRGETVIAGSGFSFTAVAKDNSGQPLPGTLRIIWSSLDPTIATVTSASAGAGIALGARGTARIVAQLLTGPADTVQLSVILPASQITAVSGGGQTGVAGAVLAQPLVVKVTAADGIGAPGVTVNFAVATGGGSVSASVVSDANGLAQTTWKLGPTSGPQSVTAFAGTLTNSPLTFAATAQAATATKLVITTPPASGQAGVPLLAHRDLGGR